MGGPQAQRPLQRCPLPEVQEERCPPPEHRRPLRQEVGAALGVEQLAEPAMDRVNEAVCKSDSGCNFFILFSSKYLYVLSLVLSHARNLSAQPWLVLGLDPKNSQFARSSMHVWHP